MEIQIKTAMRYHLTPVRMAVIKKTKDKCCQGYGEKEPLYSRWECKLVQTSLKTVWRFLKKLKIELTYDTGSLFLDIYPKELKSGS